MPLFYLLPFFSQCKAPDPETYRFHLINIVETHPSRICAKFSSSLIFFLRSFPGYNRMFVATLRTKWQPFSPLLLPIHHSFSVVWEHYFMWQFISLFILIVPLDGRQRSAFRYSSLPWVGVHAYSSSVKKSNPITGLDRPWGFPAVEAVQDNRHMRVVSSSALHTGRFYPPGNNAGNHFC